MMCFVPSVTAPPACNTVPWRWTTAQPRGGRSVRDRLTLPLQLVNCSTWPGRRLLHQTTLKLEFAKSICTGYRPLAIKGDYCARQAS